LKKQKATIMIYAPWNIGKERNRRVFEALKEWHFQKQDYCN
jgi:hypothetical protein